MKALSKNTCREILRSPGRFLAILAIIVLGSGFFVGLRVSQKAMTATAGAYLDKTNFYDFSISTTLGLTQEDVDALLRDPEVLDAEGSFELDALVDLGSGTDLVFAFHTLPERINLPELLEGRLPTAPGECLADSWTNLAVGDKILISGENDGETLDRFALRELTVTGIATSPLYLNFERGSTSLGAGSVTAFCYVTPSTFDTDYFTAVYLRCPQMGAAYSKAYERRADDLEERLTALADERARARYDRIVADAREELADGRREYDDARAEYESRRADAERELADALQALEDARKELEEGEAEYAADLKLYSDGEAEYADGEKKLEDARKDLEAGEAEYARGLAEYNAALEPYNAGVAELEAGKARLDESRALLDAQQAQMDTLLSAMLEGINEQLPAFNLPPYASAEELLAAVESGNFIAVYAVDQALRVAAERAPEAGLPADSGALLAARSELAAGWDAWRAGQEEYEANAARLSSAAAQLDESRAVLEDARRELDDGRRELQSGLRTLADNRAQLDEAKRLLEDGRARLDEGRRSYEDGLREYEDAQREAEEEFSDAERELADALVQLEDAQREIDELQVPDAYLLGRWSNLGYVCFENDTSIVRSISSVFPLFFFLVAALICVTTVSRMVEEQRSQLGVLMALGYSRLKVMGKFLIYSGSATVLGAAAGILLGSRLIPLVVWQAYKIMYSFSDRILFYFDLPLSAVTFALYLAAMMTVTWLSCRRELRDTPANVIRPKPPKAGKRVLLERVPFIWDRLSFLWKVTVRNIFRYKLRVLMMILGVAGCTALMLTGMGINDSIRNVVDYQYTEISLYDYSVAFSGHLDESGREEFLAQAGDGAQDALFLHQTTVTASAGRSEKEVQLSAVDAAGLQRIGEFMDFHRGARALPFPEKGEALVNSGLARALGLSVGDTLELRPEEGPSLSVKVSGIYDNYIYNTVYIRSDTLGADPEINYALVLKDPSADTGEVLAEILGMDGVLTATASLDMRQRIGNMMASLIYIVLLTIVCAAALAFVVIYNLTNINIQERLREIATVKVLGFYDFESALYVLRENLLLTLLGAAVGIPMGLALNAFVISRIELDIIHFTPRVAPVSYLGSVALTLLFSLLVDLFMLRRLSSIDPAGALKAAE